MGHRTPSEGRSFGVFAFAAAMTVIALVSLKELKDEKEQYRLLQLEFNTMKQGYNEAVRQRDECRERQHDNP